MIAVYMVFVDAMAHVNVNQDGVVLIVAAQMCHVLMIVTVGVHVYVVFVNVMTHYHLAVITVNVI
jgi:hypothetical protein